MKNIESNNKMAIGEDKTEEKVGETENKEHILQMARALQEKLERIMGQIYDRKNNQYSLAEIKELYDGTGLVFRNREFGWLAWDELDKAAQDAISEAHLRDERALAKLKSMDIKGLPIAYETFGPIGQYPGPYLCDNLLLGDEKIQFGTEGSIREAYKWAMENGAMDKREYDVRKIVSNGGIFDSEIRKSNPRDNDPDIVDILTDGKDKIELRNIFTNPLYQLAKQLIKERGDAEKEKITIKIIIKQHISKKKKPVVVEVEGKFTEVINEALRKIDENGIGSSRSAFDILVVGVGGGEKGGHQKSEYFFTGSNVAGYLKKINHSDFIERE